MALDLRDCSFSGPALPEPFVKFELEPLLATAKLLAKPSGAEGKKLADEWDILRRKLRGLGDVGGAVRVANHVLEPLTTRLGYSSLTRQEAVDTREGTEDGGWLMSTPDGESRLRAWTVDVGVDLDAPSKRGRAYRFSPSRIAQRVLLAKGERAGILTDGVELRLLLCDPARTESHLAVRLTRAGGWRGALAPPDSYRLLLALASPRGVAAIPKITEQARLTQTRVTTKLREQAKAAVIGYVQELYEDGRNAHVLAPRDDAELARQLWREGLVVVYRLLFILKLESAADPARAFSFSSTTIWRNTYSPNTALGPLVRKMLDTGVETGAMLGDGVRTVFRLFQEGLSSSELKVSPLGGMLFGPEATPLLDSLHWNEPAIAKLLDNLLWTPKSGRIERQRVYYGSLDVEDLGRVYEALLELEPGIATEPMCRLRRQKLEVVVPLAQGERYRTIASVSTDDEGDGDAEDEEPEAESSRAKAKVQWIEEIAPGRFYLRVGLGRKATGSYYTPDPFVRFLVQETLALQVAERSPPTDPNPAGILSLNVLDPATGSGHFLVGACRYLGEKLYEACRLCDEGAAEVEEQAAKATPEKATELLQRAANLRSRVEDLPDPNDELVAYLPSRVIEGEQSGVSQSKALAICRRLVAVHCLYGVDKNPLAVELAKLSLWLESYAEGLPLTFLDHRIVCGDSLTGPFFEHLLTYPGSGERINNLFARGVTEKLTTVLAEALVHVRDLEASVGKDVADIEQKRAAKLRLDGALQPLKVLAAAWAGGVMLGPEHCDDVGYEHLLRSVADREEAEAPQSSRPGVAHMIQVGMSGVPYDLAFPEVFYPNAEPTRGGGFDVVMGNPPWDTVRKNDDGFLAAFDFRVLDLPTKAEKRALFERLLTIEDIRHQYAVYVESLLAKDRSSDRTFTVHKARVKDNLAGRGTYDDYMLFAERSARLVRPTSGRVGMVFPSAFHANEGSTGVRRLYLEDMHLETCFSFENRNKLFEIHLSFKFALVVARHGANEGSSFKCAFYLHDVEWLFSGQKPLEYTLQFVRSTGAEYLTFLELRTPADALVAAACYRSAERFGEVRERVGIRLTQEVNMTYDSSRFTATNHALGGTDDPRRPSIACELRAKGYLPLHEGKTFHQYTDRWEERPRYIVGLDKFSDKPAWIDAARHFRLAFRDIARSTDERTAIFVMVPPGVLFGHTAPCERSSSERSSFRGLVLMAIVNSFTFDWTVRQKTAAHVSLFILDGCPVPPSCLKAPRCAFLAHAALRLSCNHDGYAPLWHEQLGALWREPIPKQTWPVLDGGDMRWIVRASIDAVVADAYGLSPEQYAHVLGSFSHKSYPKAPDLCLAAFDELKDLGLEAFTKRHDPYWDIPLVEALPSPVIDLAPAVTAQQSTGQLSLVLAGTAPKSRRRAR